MIDRFPKTNVAKSEQIPGLPDDLQMAGKYLMKAVESTESEIENLVEDLEAFEADPIEYELNLEEEFERAGYSSKEIKSSLEEDLDPEKKKKEIEEWKLERKRFSDALEMLKIGDHVNTLKFFTNELRTRKRTLKALSHFHLPELKTLQEDNIEILTRAVKTLKTKIKK